MNELNDFFAAVAKQKAEDPKRKLLKETRSRIQKDAQNIFAQLEKRQPVNIQQINEVVRQIEQLESGKQVVGEFIFEDGKYEGLNKTLNEVVVPQVKPASQQVPMNVIDKYLKQGASFQQPEPDDVDPNIKAIQDKLKFVERWLGKIAAHGPGSGEVNLRYLDDVDRSSISDGRYLKYNDTTKKFEFDEINTNEVVQNVTYVTTSTYAVQSGDYYIGVDYAGPCTITMPVSPSSGRRIIIKDESGNAETYPITIDGNIDNDSNGAVLALDNGALQLIYHRGGWRII